MSPAVQADSLPLSHQRRKLPINFFLKNETVILKEFFEDLIITSNGGGIVGSEKISLSYQFLDFDFFLVGGDKF